jgi:hypothetical protein
MIDDLKTQRILGHRDRQALKMMHIEKFVLKTQVS